MAGIRWPPEDSELLPARAAAAAAAAPAGELQSDDDRSVAADSWSIKSDYGSTLDDEQRHADAAEVLAVGSNFPASTDFEKEAPDAVFVETSIMGLQNYSNSTYAEDDANYHDHSHVDEDWFGAEIMEVLVDWTKNLFSNKDLSTLSVLDVGTGNGRLLQQLAKQGFPDLTGIDYSESEIEVARNHAIRDGFTNIHFMVDDVLETKLDRRFQLVMDEGTLDAIGYHPDGPIKRIMYWESVARLVAAGGILVITSCTSTKDELVQEVRNFNRRKQVSIGSDEAVGTANEVFQYFDNIQTYPTIISNGGEGHRLTTVAFIRK